MDIDDILESENLAADLDDKKLAEISEKVRRGHQRDLSSREAWESNLSRWMKLALQVTEKKSYPWPDAANVKYPLISIAAMQFAARAYPALIPGPNVVKGLVIGFDPDGKKQNRAVRISKHMSYQIMQEIPDWEEQMDKLCMMLPIVGTVFKKTYHDPIKRVSISELVSPKDLVVDYWAKSLESAKRITHRLELSKNDIFVRIKSGMYIDFDIRETPFTRDFSDRREISLQSADLEDAPYEVLEQHTFEDIDDDGYEEPYIITVCNEKVVRIVPRFTSADISYSPEGKFLGIEPEHYFTKFSFIPNPEGGFYDLGFGVLLGPLNDTINTLINQLLDAGTLSNLQAGFLSKGIRIRTGETPLRPGEWITANATGDDLRKGIFPLPPREPSSVLLSLLGMVIDAGNRLSVSEMMTGHTPGQNQKATTTMAVLEQSMKVFSAIHKRMHRALGIEFKKLYHLNKMYLAHPVYFSVLDGGQSVVVPFDYTQDTTDVIPYSDPNISTEQTKLLKAEAVMNLIQLGTINPQVATQRMLEALEVPSFE